MSILIISYEKDEWWTKDHEKLQTRLVQLFPNTSVAIDSEAFGPLIIPALLQTGQLYVNGTQKDVKKTEVKETLVLVLQGGKESECHENCKKLFIDKKIQHWFIGYALCSEDNLWNEHSWGTDDKGNIIETTFPRLAYFGLCYDERQH